MSALKRYSVAEFSGGLVVLHCCACNEPFGISDAFEAAKRSDRKSFYCPRGHEQHFPGKTADQLKIEQLSKDLEAAKRDAESQARRRAWAESTAHGARIKAGKAKAEKDRVIKRVHAGVCPHCNRTFSALARHMASQHPSESGR